MYTEAEKFTLEVSGRMSELGQALNDMMLIYDLCSWITSDCLCIVLRRFLNNHHIKNLMRVSHVIGGKESNLINN